MDREDNSDNRNKKKGTKKNSVNVPLSELGFKAKVYQGVETEYTRRRLIYKAARYGIENSRQCFMGRLTFMIDPTTFTYDQLADLPNFKGIKNNQWDKIKKIVFHSRDVLRCAICLQQDFKAPQMTSCGHVFCWHCILMHHYKSLKANNCPVCNETYSIENVVSCQPIFDRSFKQIEENRIKFSLKYRREGGNQIFNCSTHEEDIDFSKIIKITSEKVAEIFAQERDEIMNYLHRCDDGQIRIWLEKTVSLAWEKIEKASKNVAGREYRLHKNEKKVDGIIFAAAPEKSNTVYFYQQASGKLIYLHPLCDKYLRKGVKELPLALQQQILYWQEMEYNMEATRRYKCLNHITVNQEIDMVVISMKDLIAQQQNREFQKQFENTKIKKKEEMEREERESVRLQIVYEQQKEYMQKLKKMQESEFYDIRVPTTINPSELEDVNYFPSLIQTKSSPAEFHEYFPPSPKVKQSEKEKKPVLALKEGDFPELCPGILRAQSETLPTFVSAVQMLPKKQELPKLPSKLPSKQQQFPDINHPIKKPEQPSKQPKKNRAKKQKFVNVTAQFFNRPQDDPPI